MGLKLLENSSYERSNPDHQMLNSTLKSIVDRAKHFLTKQQFTWLSAPMNETRDKVPVLKVIPKVHKNLSLGDHCSVVRHSAGERVGMG
jgi:hypothetical protein